MTVQQIDYRAHPILYVADEQASHGLTARGLGDDLTLLTAESADQALDMVAREPVAVLLCDLLSPGASVVDLVRQVATRHPAVIPVVLTACPEADATLDAIKQAGVSRFVKDPWTHEELEAVLRDSILAHRNSRLVGQHQEQVAKLH